MTWTHLAVNSTNIILLFFGTFMTIFMLTSAFIQSKIHIGAANIAFLVGIIFGPVAANLFNPLDWSNIETVVLEISRVVLVTQCFANGVELPKAYIERHWRSIAWILGPAMLFGWLVSACCVKFMLPTLGWREVLACAACFTAIDPILAATALTSGTFYRRVPKHLRDILRAEGGFNGITTTLVLDLSIYLLQYQVSGRKIAFHFFILAIGYEVLFGALAGWFVGYAARHTLWIAKRRGAIDRPSFLSYYLALSLFCAGLGSILGVDEVLMGFCAGYALDQDGRYQEETEGAKMSQVIDLLLNLTYFVFLGTVIPWSSFDSSSINIEAWRLVIGTLMIFLFRRLPVFSVLKYWIPDIKTFREALWYAHFGPVGAGAVFAALLIKAQLTPGSAKSLNGPSEESPYKDFLLQLWPAVTFVVVCSSIVHGSSISVFSLGKRINTLTLTISYTRDEHEEPSWMTRLPRITDQSRSTYSVDSIDSIDSIFEINDETQSGLDEGPEIVIEDPEGNILRTIAVAGKSRREVTEEIEEIRRGLVENHEARKAETIDPYIAELSEHPRSGTRKGKEKDIAVDARQQPSFEDMEEANE